MEVIEAAEIVRLKPTKFVHQLKVMNKLTVTELHSPSFYKEGLRKRCKITVYLQMKMYRIAKTPSSKTLSI
jgi:hypothetical protein